MQAVYKYGKRTTRNYTPASDVAAGQVVVLTDTLGVAPLAIAANELGVVDVSGVFEVDKIAEDGFDDGESVYWDANGVPASDPESTDGALSSNPEDGLAFGTAVGAAGDDDEKAMVWLNQAPIPSDA